MTATYETIQLITLGSNQSSVTFSSIPGTYTDLRLITNCEWNGGNDRPIVRLNSDTSSSYSIVYMYGNGSSIFARVRNNSTSFQIPYDVSASDNIIGSIFDIASYSDSKYKTLLASVFADLNGSGWSEKSCGMWRNTSSVNSITITLINGNSFKTGSSFALYGIAKE